jgi:hypothetical protein
MKKNTPWPCLLVPLVCLIWVAGCSKKPYTTMAVQSEIATLKQSKLAIASFSCDPDIAIKGGSVLSAVLRKAAEDKKWEQQLARKLSKAHFTDFLRGLEASKTVQLVGNLTFNTDREAMATTEASRLARTIEEAGADFGLVVYDKFGWQWGPADTGIQYYDVRTEVAIINRRGQVIWGFKSDAVVFPATSVEHFVSGVAATTPSDERILKDCSDLFSNHPRFVWALIEEDIVGKAHKQKFYDYVNKSDTKARLILINSTK